VGTAAQSVDLGLFVGARSEQQHADVGVGMLLGDLPADLDAVHARQHVVDYHRVRCEFAAGREPVLSHVESGSGVELVADALHANGGHIVSQDSDGDMRPVIDAFLDAGVNCMYPFEPAAGMDMVAARQRYGERLAIKGGIDKFALRSGRAAIDRELADKLQPCMQRGTVFGLDHRIPGGVPLDDYRYYVSRARELLGLDPYPEPGWQRMAF